MKTLLLTLCLFVSIANAAPLTARLVHARGPGQIPQVQSRALFQRALTETCKETGVCLRLARFSTIKNPFQIYHDDYFNADFILALWDDYFAKRSHADIRFASVPPFIKSGSRWMLGVADGACVRQGTAYSTAEEKNSVGAYRIPWTYLAMKHELWHLLGAKHRDGICNMMHPDALGCYPNVPILAKSISDIRGCSGRW